MKIAILTQPLADNYGCILQNYALQKVLRDKGNNVVTIRRESKPSIFMCIRNTIAILVRLLHIKATCTYSNKELSQIRCNFKYFINKYIVITNKTIYSSKGLLIDFKKNNYDAYIIGSDQVWRLGYSPCIFDYFLSFLPLSYKVKRIAYAASFGTDNWEFSRKVTNLVKKYIYKFDLITVREKSAVKLCEEYLNYDKAEFVLDPTMLLDKEDYERLIINENEKISKGNIFCYILDKNDMILDTISEVEKYTGKIAFEISPKHSIEERQMGFNSDDYVLPSITKWLRAFMDADYVITDSFHGTVFSLVFNKPFVVFGNKHRGNARFISLLETFRLKDRLILSKDNALKVFKQPINWNKVNVIREKMKEKSTVLLFKNLEK